ncbi:MULTISPECIES: hypothetical protein [unclassified Cellulomonas]|uniref:hypothetical protein n=1 Tax=unclassified Cellulomonas TaxID=2620175 RepID=UPI001C4FC656|nr:MULTISPECIES: hypothetical protein [unclassified Cellulomonas]MBW0254485.1 hypothetical protein [Cellulomonas sp. PS-H5]MCG7284712.1 hypothetical protein [Cellulomonas sp. ACRRI]
MDPSLLTVTELTNGLRSGAAGRYPSEAAVELLIRHWTWLARPGFARDCVWAPAGESDVLFIRWDRLIAHASSEQVDLPPADRAVALIAAHLGAWTDPQADWPGLERIPPLSWLLASLPRAEVALVLAAISHAAGTHDQVDHVGEPGEGDGADRWRVTATSPRLPLGPLYQWPDPALPGLADPA